MAKKATKKPITYRQVLCKTTCQGGHMGLGYCVAGRVYTVRSDVKLVHHFEWVKSPLEEINEEAPEKEEEDEG